MGCSGSKQKKFNELSQNEKDSIIQLMKLEDDNLEFIPPKSNYENFDWKGLIENIPSEKDKLEKRYILFKKINKSERNYISTKKLKNNFIQYFNLPDEVIKKDPISLASQAAIYKYNRYPENDTVLQWSEFRIFLLYLKQYFTYWKFFFDKKKSVEESLSLEEFKEIIPLIKNFGVEFKEDEIEKEFERMVNDEQGITFDGFCCDIIQNNFAKDKDDHFDDDKLDEFNNK